MSLFSPDLLNAAIEDLDKALYEVVSEYHPAFEMLLKGSPEIVKGDTATWVLATQGPGKGRAISRGMKLPAGRKDITKKATYVPGAWSYAFDFDELEMGLAMDADQIGILMDGTLSAAYADMMNRVIEQLVNGNAPEDTSVLPTLNGDVTYDPQGDGVYSQQGLMRFQAPAAQNVTAFGVMRQGGTDGVARHANGYGEVTSVKGNGVGGGLRTLADVIMYSNQGGQSAKIGIPTIGLTDGASYLNWLERYENRYVPIEFRDDGGLPGDFGRMALKLTRNFTLHWEPALDPTLTVFNGGSGYNGIMYGLNPKDVHPIAHSLWTKVVGNSPVPELKGLFKQREFVASNDGFEIKSATLGWFGIAMKSLASHFVLIGTGNE